MAKSFRRGFEYVYTSKKFKKYMGFKGIALRPCNGRPVEVKSEVIGLCDGYLVIPKWCKCIGEEKSVF